MVLRNFPNFLSAYFDYANDNFCPPQFHMWTGISLLAAILERKVSLQQGKIHHFPNMYVMLVSHPGVGKSTAMDVGMDLLETLKEHPEGNKFRIIPTQITEPGLIDMMKIINSFPIAGGKIMMRHSSGFFYASEASASALQNTCGDFVSAMTQFYDCPKFFRKKLKMEQQATELVNVSMNMLAGSTFNYLRELVNERSVMGGFASRLNYIISDERKIREAKWNQDQKVDEITRNRLIEDMLHIHKLSGPMKPTEGFIKCFEEWQPKFDKQMIELKSERLESINARNGTKLIKLAMVLSISESDKLVVTEKHFEMARQMIENTSSDHAFVLAQAVMADKESQSGLVQVVLRNIENGHITCLKEITSFCLKSGFRHDMIEGSIKSMLTSKMIAVNADGTVVGKEKADRML